MNASVHKQFGSQTKVFNKILFMFANSTLGDKHSCSCLPHTNTNAVILPKITKQIKFVS